MNQVMERINRDKFSSYHPIVNFTYFVLVIFFALALMHPISQAISLFWALVYYIYLQGGRALKMILIYLLPLFFLAIILNPAFSHQGVTILTYLPGGNPLTLESLLYGISAGAMIITVILWFTSFNLIITSDKFIYLFGRLAPGLSLILSMTLAFLPKFRDQFKKIAETRKMLGEDVYSEKKLIGKIRKSANILSATVTWALENAVDTADSMKGRGYGLPGRTAYSIYDFHKRDKLALISLLLMGTLLALAMLSGKISWQYYPLIKGADLGGQAFLTLILYFFLCSSPLAINLREDLRWKATRLTV